MLRLGEGPVWWGGVLWFVDIVAGKLCRYEPETGGYEDRVVAELLGAAGPCDDGRWMLATERGLSLLDWGSGEVEVVSQVLADTAFRFNDGKADPAGRFWVGTMATGRDAGPGWLYRWEAGKGEPEAVLPGVTISNGLDWSADGKRMYYIDTPTRRVDVFDYDVASGSIRDRRTLVEIPEGKGSPDGMCLDAEGHAWVGFWGGRCVRRFDGQTGELLAEVAVPALNVTSCCFGGENYETLYVTTASVGMSEEERAELPEAGRVFSAEVGVGGRAGHVVRVG